MSDPLLDERMRQLYAARTRRTIHAARMQGDRTTPSAVIPIILNRGLWRYWGYDRLGDCLMQELGLNVIETMKWVHEAIRRGVENADQYRNPNHCRPTAM
jgi:hypothetical protein